ncbi:MAG: TorF family putative porin [Burkholderiaceae bacterium]
MKNSSLLRSALLLCSALGAAAPVAAADTSPVVGNVGFASEYRFRGLSQSDFKPAVSAGLDYAHESGLYLGTWASSISWLSDAGVGGSSIEWDVYGGYKGSAGPISYDVGGLYYYYPGRYPDGFTRPYTFELYAAGTWEFLTLKYSHALTNAFGFTDSKNSGYLDLAATYPMMEGLNLVAHVGHQWIKGSSEVGRSKSDCSYTDWKLGVTYDWAGATWGIAYVDTNAKDGCYNNYRGKNIGDARAVASVSKTF